MKNENQVNTNNSNIGQLNRMPTLNEVLSRKTRPPVDLFCLYLFLQREGAEDALDFWLDTQQHENLCKAYFKDIRKSGKSVQQVWPQYWYSARDRGSVYSDIIGLAVSDTSDNSDHLRFNSSSPLKNNSQSTFNQSFNSFNSTSHDHHSPNNSSLTPEPKPHSDSNVETNERLSPNFYSYKSSHNKPSTIIPRNNAITQSDLFDSANRIFSRYLAPGSDKEIYLPPTLRIQSFGHHTPLSDIPDLFYAQKEYIFRALEGGVFPRFLRAKGFGNLTPMSSLIRLGLGLFILWFSFSLGFCFIFLDYKPQKTRVWVLLPFIISFYLLWSFKYNLDPLMILFSRSETTPFKSIGIEEPYIKKLLIIRSM